jgi:hypothetical protein
MQQNFLISANSFVQRAGIAALSKVSDTAVARMRAVYDKRRKVRLGREYQGSHQEAGAGSGEEGLAGPDPADLPHQPPCRRDPERRILLSVRWGGQKRIG